MKPKFLWIAILLILTIATAANAAEHWRIVSVPLDMPLDDQSALDDQALEGLYQGDYGKNMAHNYSGYIGTNLRSSGLNESPFYRINSTLKDGRDFELWFSSAADGRKTFGVRLNMPWLDEGYKPMTDALKDVETAFGKPDLEFSPSGRTAQKVLVIADRTMPKDRYNAVVARMPKANQISSKDAESFWNSDLQEFARLLGPDFRGAIMFLNSDLKSDRLVSGTALLVDLARARTVFNLGQPK